MIDHTHHAAAKSWVASAHGHTQFPLQNLPLGVFSAGSARPSIGVAIGDKVLDLAKASLAGLLPGKFADALGSTDLASLLALGRPALTELRHALFALLVEGAERDEVAKMLVTQANCRMHLPLRPGGYTDFYAGIHHAENVGKLFRPDQPLLPNYKYVPIGYHGRTSTIRVSGESVRRPKGQLKTNDSPPRYAPSERLDYEVELGLWVAGGNALGEPIAITEAGQHLAGVTLLNDWSARDIQAWEYQPLGPFLSKNFMTTVSPWLVTMDALEPFRIPQKSRDAGDPEPLDYLAETDGRALDIAIEVSLARAGKPPAVVGRTSARELYWTPEQLLTHHAANGCRMEPGDLLGTGTISGDTPSSLGSLLELNDGAFLGDGDEVIMTARCERDGFASIGFGECRGVVTAS